MRARLSKEEQAERVAAKVETAQAVLAERVAGLGSGEDWCRFLEFQARFHQYSPNNVMLIHAQHAQAFADGLVPTPEPGFVAGFNTWKALGRRVVRGRHGYAVLAPMVGQNRMAVTEDGRERRLGPVDAVEVGEVEERRKTLRGFRLEHVFEVGQTSGADLPEPVLPSLQGGVAPPGLGLAVMDVVERAGFTVDTVPDANTIGGANGRTDWAARTVVVRADIDDAAMVKTLIHEAAHVVLHEGPPARYLPRPVKEVEAESIAYVAVAAHGMATDGYSFPYVAGWAGPEPEQAVHATQARVAKASRLIIEASTAVHGSGGKVPGADAAVEAARRTDLAGREPSRSGRGPDRPRVDPGGGVMAGYRVPTEEQITTAHQALVAALAGAWEIAERGGPDFSGAGAFALQDLSAAMGGAQVLLRSRPGSWEAVDVGHLAASIDDWELGL